MKKFSGLLHLAPNCLYTTPAIFLAMAEAHAALWRGDDMSPSVRVTH